MGGSSERDPLLCLWAVVHVVRQRGMEKPPAAHMGVKFSYATAVPAHLDVTFFTGSF